MKERDYLQNEIDKIKKIETKLNDIILFVELASEENNSEVLIESKEELLKFYKYIKNLCLEKFFSDEVDKNDCFVEIHSGAGGVDAQDWAEMLLRMYIRWSELRKYKVDFLEESAGEEAGIKSATLKVKGMYSYGWLKFERGVHRLVRISPFDASSRRHTSFASVWVYPVIDESIEIEINAKDLRIDTYRASGAGGQHVNRTDSAVRITHLPTGIVVQCQSDRSQHRNKAQAMNMLKAKLYEIELRERKQQTMKEHESKTEIGWGNQIRSYVLHPYRIVKDLRYGIEERDVQKVLDGGLDVFLNAALTSNKE